MKKTLLRIITVASVLTVLFTVASIPVSAATYYNKDIYLKIDGIEGESKDSKHDKWIDVLYFNHASVQSVQTGSPDAAGRGIFEPIVFKHVVDKATPKLHEACMKGNHFKSAELHYCRVIAGKQEIAYNVKFEGIKIVKAEVETETLEDGTVRLIETVSFLVNKQTWTQTAIGLDNALGGSTEAVYDQSKKASMFDSNANLALTIACAVIFVLVVVIVILAVGKKKKVAVANAPANEKDKQDS